ncbi:MAG: helix-turn-helix transcriptional regulator [Oscillospiraceae bacterium]|nr:helix-turn-helix transcriptional regulator [Oscillospiraceae bacterium]
MLNPLINVLAVQMGHHTARSAYDSIIMSNPKFVDIAPDELSMQSVNYYILYYFFECDDFPVHINDTDYVFKQGHAYFLPPHTLHTSTCKFNTENWAVTFKFRIPDSEFKKKLGDVPIDIPCSEAMQQLISDIIVLKPDEKEKRTELCVKLLSMIIGASKKHYIKGNIRDGNEHEFFDLIKYLYNNIRKDITLSDMADSIHMDKYHFAKKFKSMYNISPIDFLYSLRLTLSLDVLIHSNVSIAKVAEEVGFRNTSAYCTAFRRAYGVTPNEYRRLGKKKQFTYTPLPQSGSL